MKIRRTILFALVLIIAGLTANVSALDMRVVRSAVFPGMGQLGDGQTAKGLLYMGGEIALISVMVDQISRANSYARETEYLQVQSKYFDPTQEKQIETYEKWQAADKNSRNAKNMSYALGGASVALWAWNIIDCIIFAPKSEDESSVVKTLHDNLCLSVNPSAAAVLYKIDF